MIFIGINSAINSLCTINTTPDYQTVSWVFSVASLLIAGPLEYGLITVSKTVKSDKMPEVKEMFSGFLQFGKVLGLYMYRLLFVFLWTLLFIIPGVIKAFSYSLAMYLYHDDPSKSVGEYLEESKKLMNGHKWDLFCLLLSYIGWFILCVLTLGVLFCWVLPKVEQAKYNFYLAVTGKDEEAEAVVVE